MVIKLKFNWILRKEQSCLNPPTLESTQKLEMWKARLATHRTLSMALQTPYQQNPKYRQHLPLTMTTMMLDWFMRQLESLTASGSAQPMVQYWRRMECVQWIMQQLLQKDGVMDTTGNEWQFTDSMARLEKGGTVSLEMNYTAPLEMDSELPLKSNNTVPLEMNGATPLGKKYMVCTFGRGWSKTTENVLPLQMRTEKRTIIISLGVFIFIWVCLIPIIATSWCDVHFELWGWDHPIDRSLVKRMAA